ncbi:MAG: ATP-binding protein [Thermodesulfobacteriota bacterium]|jgi:predicted ATPase
MKYRYSHLDEVNLKWFTNDMTRATLATIELRAGEVRGLNQFKISFRYPISVIAGANGSGKSTILALAACAYNNSTDGFRLPGRRLPYYTMSDFFFQSVEEVPPQGIGLAYEFIHNNWRKSPRHPDGIGRGWQLRMKKKGGKWSNYSRRVDRNVAFFGIERVVPHSERSVSKSYKHYFQRAKAEGYEEKVRDVVGRVLGRKYDEFWFRQHSKYRLPHVKTKKTVYSGFNMGAGENALFEIFSTIFAAPEGLLVIADEIELGLHDSAQRKFIDELKTVCRDRHVQVICTTHSPTILDAVPPEGRFFIERHGSQTVIIPGVAPAYAAGRLAEQNSLELDVFVEDEIAQQFVQAVLPTSIRRRINILPIGSAHAIVRQMAARFKVPNEGESIAILDGDQRVHLKSLFRYFLESLEDDKDQEKRTKWFEERLTFLPGESWPEWWIFTQLTQLKLTPLANFFQITEEELQDICEKAIGSGKHHEFHLMAQNLSLPVEQVCSKICCWLSEELPDQFNELKKIVSSYID